MPVGVQVQSTPAFAVSFVTVALIDAVPPTPSEAGGVVVSEMATAEIATVALAVLVWSLLAVAVIVTFPPPGAVDGAVYVVTAPLAVCEELKDPQDPAGAQLQSTPPAAESFVTVAAIIAVALVESEAGGAWLNVMEMAGGGFDVVVELDPQPERPTASSNATPHNRNCHFAELVFTTPSYRLAGFALRGPRGPDETRSRTPPASTSDPRSNSRERPVGRGEN